MLVDGLFVVRTCSSFLMLRSSRSIPVLLEGLKTAFLTSVAGMIGAVIFKWLDACWLAGRREPEGTAEEVSPGQTLKALNDSNEHLISVRDALAKDSDSSLVGVVQRMRSDLSDRANDDRRDREAFQTKLFGEMQNFADLLSKSATEAVAASAAAFAASISSGLGRAASRSRRKPAATTAASETRES